MSTIVIDTNVLVSAMLSLNGKPAKILELVLDGNFIVCHSQEIIDEYKCVLARPKFCLDQIKVQLIIGSIEKDGISIVAQTSSIPFPDESDRIFYNVAKTSNSTLITGNTKHYPQEDFIVTPTEFLSKGY
jgi:putative PIN family toxin of toxin-antitoxin system